MQYEFLDCWLDTDTREFTRNGLPNSLEPQVFDLLLFLLENHGRILSREELIHTIWSQRTVSDSAIDARISAVRSAVGDSGARQAIIKTVPRKGFRFIAEPTSSGDKNKPETQSPTVIIKETRSAQRIRYCLSQDKTRIGYATTGNGTPFVRTGHWLTHLEHDWHSPIWHPFLKTLGESFSVTRYDQRGNGLSDWQLREFSLDRCVEDLEAVIEASGLERFVLYGSSQGAPVAVAYAARHPEQVSHLILQGGFVQGRMVRPSKDEVAQGEAILTLIRHGWGKPGGAFLKGFSSFFIPDSTKEQIDSLVDLQQKTTTAENAAIIRSAVDHFDVSALLNQVSVPTLVIHARNDSVQPLEQGQSIAAGIKNAEFVMLESSNHMILEQEPAWQVLFSEIRNFARE